MGEITLKGVRRSGLTIADLARLSHIPYQRCWRAVSGEANLKRDEVERVERVLREAVAVDA